MQDRPIYFIGGTFGSGGSTWWIAVIVALLTAVATFGVGRLLEDYKRHREASALAASLAAEISAILCLFVQLRIEEIYRNIRAGMQQAKDNGGSWSVNPESSFIFPVTVYEKCADRVGILGNETASGVVEFYNYLNGFRSGIKIALGGENVNIEGRIATIDFILNVIFKHLPKVEILRTELLHIAERRWVPFIHFLYLAILLPGTLVLSVSTPAYAEAPEPIILSMGLSSLT